MTRWEQTLNTICPYYTMFPLEFPLRQLRDARRNDVVLDPFCGRGTTLFAARALGLRAVGLDSNPVAAAIALAKLVAPTPGNVVRAAAEILLSRQKPEDVPVGEFWERCFNPAVLARLCVLREALIESCESPARIGLRALLMGSLHGPKNKGEPSYFSNQMPRTFAAKPNYAVRFWRKRRMKPEPVDVLALVKRKAEYYFRQVLPSVEGVVLCADARDFALPRRLRASWIVTSPPYYGMRMYVPDQWLRYWFVGGPAAVQYADENQMAHTSPEEFAEQLSQVWEAAAACSHPGARMVVRFGGIHDRGEADPREILRRSIQVTDCGWRLVATRSAGLATSGKRQASQFKRALKKPMEEHDFFVRLDS